MYLYYLALSSVTEGCEQMVPFCNLHITCNIHIPGITVYSYTIFSFFCSSYVIILILRYFIVREFFVLSLYIANESITIYMPNLYLIIISK